MSNISIEEKVETKLVEVSAGLIAVGIAGLAVTAQLPSEIQIPVAAVFGAIETAGWIIIRFWDKFVNVRKQVLADNKPAQ